MGKVLRLLLVVDLLIVVVILGYFFAPRALIEQIGLPLMGPTINDATATAFVVQPPATLVDPSTIGSYRPPADAIAAYNEAMAKVGDDTALIAALQRAIDLDANFAEAHLALGVVYQNVARDADAEREVRLAIETALTTGLVEPAKAATFMSNCHFVLANIYITRTQDAARRLDNSAMRAAFTQAEKELQEALRLDPDNIQARQLSEKLDSVRRIIQMPIG